jgi:hypothetical protein
MREYMRLGFPSQVDYVSCGEAPFALGLTNFPFFLNNSIMIENAYSQVYALCSRVIIAHYCAIVHKSGHAISNRQTQRPNISEHYAYNSLTNPQANN